MGRNARNISIRRISWEIIMIFVTLGTQDSPFPRILEQMEEAIQQLNIQEQVVAQIGTTKYSSSKMTISNFLIGEKFDRAFNDARFIVTHGGAGSIFKGLSLNKKMIVLPRLAELGEHNESNQLELVEKLEREGYILYARDNLFKSIAQIDSFSPKKYQSDTSEMLSAVKNFIEG